MCASSRVRFRYHFMLNERRNQLAETCLVIANEAGMLETCEFQWRVDLGEHGGDDWFAAIPSIMALIQHITGLDGCRGQKHDDRLRLINCRLEHYGPVCSSA